MSTTPPEDLFDLRKIERFLTEGKVTREQYDAYVAAQEDCSGNMETSKIAFINNDRYRGVTNSQHHDDDES
jgi:hypothetical protein